MVFRTIQNSFVSGEISPSLFGRTDLAKWHNGASTMRNFFANYRGGASSRAGLAWVGHCLQPFGNPPRDIPFQFNITQGYPLEFGDNVVVRAVTGAVTSGGLIKLTLASTRGLMTGNTMAVSGVGGTTEANGTWTITVVDATHVTLNGSTFVHAYTSGGSTSTSAGYMRVKFQGNYVVEATNPITAISKANPGVFAYTNTNYTLQNGDWIFVQNVVGMTNFNSLAWIVQGVSGANFHVTDLFGNAVDTSAFAAYVSGGTLSRIYTQVSPYAAVDLPFLKFTQSADTMSLTCINQNTGTEYPTYDLQRQSNTNWVFTAVTFASAISAPAGVAVTAHNSTTKDTFYSYVVTAIDSATGQESIASASDSAENNNISINAGSNNIIWNPVTGASQYNVYKSTPSYSVDVPIGSQYGYVGSSVGPTFTDGNIQQDASITPPTHQNPFARGTITNVNVTNGGAAYTQATIGYSITSSTGSGFAGTPIVVNGAFAGFLIANGGSGYTGSDTITITGGGAAVAATGTITFGSGNPSNNQTIIIDGVTWTFTTGVPGTNKTVIAGTLAATLNQLAADLNASADLSVSLATYTNSTTILTITYNTPGTGGNSFTINKGTAASATSGATLTGGTNTGGATATLSIGPQTGTYPGCVAYFEQRRVYANTINNPDTYYMSRPGSFLNMDTSLPTVDSDAIIGAPWAQQINGIQFMQPMTGGLIILTGSGAWNLNGGSLAAITPADQTATAQAYNGCHSHVGPIVINYDILYVQSKGSIVRDLSYNFFVNIYTGTDKTILSNHLFNYHQIQGWAFTEEPFKIVWAVRDDGVMLSFTYLKEEDVYAWARHDTNGYFVGVCSITEPPVDALYVIVQRFVRSQWVYYSERMDNRNWQDAEDSFCVDAGESYPLSFPAATLTPSAVDGTDNITSVNVIQGGSGYVAPVVTALPVAGSPSTGTGATFSATVAGGVITAISVLTTGQDYVEGQTTLQITDSAGTGAVAQPIITNIVDFTTNVSVFNSGMVGNVIRIGNSNAPVATSSGVVVNGGGKAVITSYISGTHVKANIIETITAVVPNDPNETPTPAITNQWSLGVPTTSVTGLNHLEGLTVAILGDGNVFDNQVVANGTITLSQACSMIVVGLPYVCQLQTLYLEPAGQSQTVQGARKNIYNVSVRMESSRGMQVGTNQPDQSTQPNQATVPWTGMKEFKERTARVNAGSAIPLFTGDEYINIPANWDTKGQVAIQQTYPLPANVLAVISGFQIGDTSDRG